MKTILSIIFSLCLAVSCFAQWYPEMSTDGSWGPNSESLWLHQTPPITTSNWLEIYVQNGQHNSSYWTDGMPCIEGHGSNRTYDFNNTAEHWSQQFEANDCFLFDVPTITGQGFNGIETINFSGPDSARSQRDANIVPVTIWYLKFEIDYIGDYDSYCETINVPDTLRLHTTFRESRFINNRWTGNNRFMLDGTEPFRQGFEEQYDRNFNNYFQIGQKFIHRVRPQDVLFYNEDGSYSHAEWTFDNTLNGFIGDFDLTSLRSIYTYIIIEVLSIHENGNIDFKISIGDPMQRGDSNRDGQKDTLDIFDFLSKWFTQDDCGDINCDGITNIEDIFEFLSCWFQG